MQVTPQTCERVASRQANATRPISSHLTQASEVPNDSADSGRLQALSRQLARHGLLVVPLCGEELLLSGAAGSLMAPDMRSAWLYVRQLEGRATA
jgi:hypothetical protein